MRPKNQETAGSDDLFRARLDQIIDMRHALVLLAAMLDWAWIESEIAPLYSDKGRPGIPARFAIGLLILKRIYGLSDDSVCARWVYDPYLQYFTGEEFFQHRFPHERSDLSHWRKRFQSKLDLLLAESLRVAHKAGALRTRLGRLIRDISRKIKGKAALEQAFAAPLTLARQIRSQKQRQRGWKLYSFHAPETECIGKGKASAPYEFGVKVSLVTTNRKAPGGQFVLHAKALPGNPYDGHTLKAVIEETEKLTGRAIERVYADKGYRGHEAKNPRRVFLSGQKRGVFGAIKRELKRRSAIEPVIGHMKTEGHPGRCFLKGRDGDAINATLTAAGHNLRLVLRWLSRLLRLILQAIRAAFESKIQPAPAF